MNIILRRGVREIMSTSILFITYAPRKKVVAEKLFIISSNLYYTNISEIESHAIANQKFINLNDFIIWHDQLGHLGSIMI